MSIYKYFPEFETFYMMIDLYRKQLKTFHTIVYQLFKTTKWTENCKKQLITRLKDEFKFVSNMGLKYPKDKFLALNENAKELNKFRKKILKDLEKLKVLLATTYCNHIFSHPVADFDSDWKQIEKVAFLKNNYIKLIDKDHYLEKSIYQFQDKIKINDDK